MATLQAKTKVELISYAKFSSGMPKGNQSRKVMQADDGEEASPRAHRQWFQDLGDV